MNEVDKVHGPLDLAHMNRHPNFAFFGGTVIIAVMVMAAFANVANAGGCTYSKSAEATTEEVKDKADKKAEADA